MLDKQTKEINKRVADALADSKLFEKFIRHEGDMWNVYSADGKKMMGSHKTKEDAMMQLAAIEANKVRKAHEHYPEIMAHLEEALAAESIEAVKEHINLALQSMEMMESGEPEAMMDEEEYAKSMRSVLTVTKNDAGESRWNLDIKFSKLDDDKRLVCGIVYEPDVVDTQGDSASPAEIEKAAHNFMLESATIGIMHKEDAKDRAGIVESFIAPMNMRLGNQMIRKGSWVIIVKVRDDELWKDIKSGKITGFSMAGRAKNALAA